MPDFSFEQSFSMDGSFVIGVDEVGRGAFAGPVVACALIFSHECYVFPQTHALFEVNDSKLLSAQKREYLCDLIHTHTFAYSISVIEVDVINNIGIGKATEQAMVQAIENVLKQIPITRSASLLVDGMILPHIESTQLKNKKAIIKGDQKSISIAGASILAKVYRDNLMKQLEKGEVKYNFFENKGYGTKQHRDAILKYGLSNFHRTSFDLLKYT